MGTVRSVKAAGPMSRAERDALPDDGRRHELIDGSLIVSPAPGFLHQLALAGLTRVMDAARPEGLLVLFAPFDVVLGQDTVVEPDLVVAPLADFTERDLPTAPLLAVEVLSPSTRLYDLNLKKAAYARSGCPSYWVVDPEVPSVTAWELAGGEYVEIVHAVGREPALLSRPFEVTLVPAELLRA